MIYVAATSHHNLTHSHHPWTAPATNFQRSHDLLRRDNIQTPSKPVHNRSYNYNVNQWFAAGLSHDTKALTLMINRNVINVDVRNQQGSTLLMEAAKNPNSIRFVKFLTEELGANVGAIDNHGKMASAYAQSAEIKEYLLSRLKSGVPQLKS